MTRTDSASEIRSTPRLSRRGRTIFVADTHRGEGKRFVVRADEKLTAFLELDSAIRARQSAQRIAERVKIKIDKLSRIA
jgi:hypothetical protein